MILVERINGTSFYINNEAIQQLEKTSNTVITFLNGEKLIVKDSPEDIVTKVIEFKANIINCNVVKQEK